MLSIKNKLLGIAIACMFFAVMVAGVGCSLVDTVKKSTVSFEKQYDAAVFQNCDDLELIKEYIESGEVDVNGKVFDPGMLKDVSPLYLVQSKIAATPFLRYLLDSGASPDIAYGSTTLLMCASGAHENIDNPGFGKMLVDYGADVNLKDDDGMTALDYAVRDGTDSSISYILQENPTITEKTLDLARGNNTVGGHNYIIAKKIFGMAEKQGLGYGKHKIFGLAALGKTDELIAAIEAQGGGHDEDIPFYAAACCKPKALEYFVGQGFGLTQEDESGNTLLWIAASTGNLDVVKYLVKNGADLDFSRYESYDDDPLKIAVGNDHIDVVKYLLKEGAKFNINEALGYDGFEGDAKSTQIIPSDSIEYAASNGNMEMIHLLEGSGYPMDKNAYYRALKLAIIYNQMDTAKYFLEKGADPNYTDTRFADNTPILEICARYGSLEALKLLQKHGATIKSKNSEALAAAVDSGSYDMAKHLLENGMDVNAHFVYSDGSESDTPWMAASRGGYLDIIKLLLEHGADINDRGTAMITCYSNGSGRITKYLIDRGADVNLQQADGDTALHVAALNHRTENAKLLLAAGADPSLKNDEGMTALDVAKKEGADEIAKLLEGGKS
jgi:ankyrin repeat protein